MNRNEFEAWMKRKNEEEQYLPTDDMWSKLQLYVQMAPQEQKKVILIPWMNIAASVALIISLGLGTHVLLNKRNIPTENSIISKGSPPGVNKDRVSVSNAEKIVASAAATGNTKAGYVINRADSNHNTKVADITASLDTPNISKAPFEAPGKGSPMPNRLVKENGNKQENLNNPYPVFLFTKGDKEKKRGSFNLGIAANIGKPSVGSVGYQLGIVGRADIANAIFAEATIAMSSTSVNYSQGHTFSGIESSNDGFLNSSKKDININANYARNVISIGLSPSLGVRITPKLSVSGGGALYRNLNPELSLTNQNEIESAALTNDIISTSEKVSNWDLGLTGNADYKITGQLSFNANYRQGLSNYLHFNNKYHKNSGFNIGLKYIFGK